MSTVVQTIYRPQIAPGIVGMIADETDSEVGTRLCETTAGIGFGLAVSQGTRDKGAVLGGSAFLGVTVRDVTLDGVPIDPLVGVHSAADMYPLSANMGVCSRGHIWVKPMATVKAGDPLFYDTTDGSFGNSASGEAASGSVVFTTNPVAGQTITINGTAITFVASGATGAQVNIGLTLGSTIANLAAFINSYSNAALNTVTASAYPESPGGLGEGSGANTLMIAAAAVGVGAGGSPNTGDSITLATNVPGTTLSGATLGGGTAAATAIVGGYWLSSAIAGGLAKISLGIQR